MIDVILAFLFGYYLKQSEKKTHEQIASKYIDSIEYDGRNYGYVREGESVEDLT